VSKWVFDTANLEIDRRGCRQATIKKYFCFGNFKKFGGVATIISR
jgi:hypothetical protein